MAPYWGPYRVDTADFVPGCRVRVLRGRNFPCFKEREEGIVIDVDSERRNCHVLFDPRPGPSLRAGAVLVALRHLRIIHNDECLISAKDGQLASPTDEHLKALAHLKAQHGSLESNMECLQVEHKQLRSSARACELSSSRSKAALNQVEQEHQHLLVELRNAQAEKWQTDIVADKAQDEVQELCEILAAERHSKVCAADTAQRASDSNLQNEANIFAESLVKERTNTRRAEELAASHLKEFHALHEQNVLQAKKHVDELDKLRLTEQNVTRQAWDEQQQLRDEFTELLKSKHVADLEATQSIKELQTCNSLLKQECALEASEVEMHNKVVDSNLKDEITALTGLLVDEQHAARKHFGVCQSAQRDFSDLQRSISMGQNETKLTANKLLAKWDKITSRLQDAIKLATDLSWEVRELEEANAELKETLAREMLAAGEESGASAVKCDVRSSPVYVAGGAHVSASEVQELSQKLAEEEARSNRLQDLAEDAQSEIGVMMQRQRIWQMELQAEVTDYAAIRDLLQVQLAQSEEYGSEEAAISRQLQAQMTSSELQAQTRTGWCGPTPVLRQHVAVKLPTALFEAAALNDTGQLEAAFAQGEREQEALFKASDSEGRTLLHVAVATGAFDTAQLLLAQFHRWTNKRKHQQTFMGELFRHQANALANCRDHAGRSPLSILCTHEETPREVSVALLQAGADPRQCNMSGVTPFLECSRSGNVSLARLLLELTHGDVLHDVDLQGRSALHWAAVEGRSEMVSFLLKLEVEPNVEDNHSMSPLHLAESMCHTDTAHLIKVALGDVQYSGVPLRDSNPEIADQCGDPE